jgi:hypothetical protein
MRKIVSLSLLILITAFLASEVSAQQLREVARQVDTSVVVIKTVEKNLLARESGVSR